MTGFYGFECQNTCSGNCRYNTTCNFITACTDGAYGLHCSSKCSHCRDSGVCEKVTGNCPAGGCERGFKGAKCDTSSFTLQ
ncbi:hypothetical protein MAR_022907 [Mya arenaria]|uniref:EGF-like domain-containing protein n=1 Tax=Mya arenaria TaxID=6604 RepID=A0ABY7DLG6_MYAAR|nr:hypothetical protein MAR_022907 [Mya arenaria]